MSRLPLDIVRAVKALSQLRRTGPLDVRRVGVEGLLIGSQRDRLVDVSFDGRRIWSFWLMRDGEKTDDGVLLTWPKPLRPFLDGVTDLTLSDPGNDTVLFAVGAPVPEPASVLGLAAGVVGLGEGLRRLVRRRYS